MDAISGYVEHIIYQNPENGYTVMELMGEEAAVTCVGSCRGLSEGETIEAQGEYTEHPMYGTQFKISSYQTVAPKDRVSMERYLGSGAIKGIGAALAARIVKKFGDDTFRVVVVLLFQHGSFLGHIRDLGQLPGNLIVPLQ